MPAAPIPIPIPSTPPNSNHISASQQWQLANLTRLKMSHETRAREANLRRLVALCNTLDLYHSQLKHMHSLRHFPNHRDSYIHDDADDELELDADYAEGEVLEWFGDFGDEDAPVSASPSNQGRVVQVGKLVDVLVQVVDDDSEDSASDDEDSHGSSCADDDDEHYLSDSSVDEIGCGKDGSRTT
ncbi:hypothetical protein FKW77_000614 [Venturia effusa]|uniref:SERTA domain-containing protein n=1 Tax=Venturia effusa TaxID=50376 RepID=A0A517L4Q1_9PEZI|nr:hypothetical protein FKW77_000614 [Venturia effusa]